MTLLIRVLGSLHLTSCTLHHSLSVGMGLRMGPTDQTQPFLTASHLTAPKTKTLNYLCVCVCV